MYPFQPGIRATTKKRPYIHQSTTKKKERREAEKEKTTTQNPKGTSKNGVLHLRTAPFRTHK